MARTALLLGATGLVGARCLEHLLREPTYARVICLVRRPLPEGSARPAEAKLEERVVDFDAISAVPKADDVYCAIGTTMKKAGSKEAFRRVDHDIPLRVIQLAVQNGAERVALVSSVGASASSSTFYLKTKGELEDAVAALPLRAFHVFRPSFLAGDRAESRAGEKIALGVMRVAQGLLVGGLHKYRPVSVDDVGKAMVSAMLGPDPERDRASPSRAVVHHLDAILAFARSRPT